MTEMRIIHPSQVQLWHQVLVRCGYFDVYHLPEYHLAVRDVDDGEPLLLCYEDGPFVAALPLLIRRVANIAELAESEWKDASSAYGYPGLLTNCSALHPQAEAFRTGWQRALSDVLLGLRVVAVFVRQHPLHDTSWMWQTLAVVRPLGHTVVIDLRRPEDEQQKVLRADHRSDIRRAAAHGITVREDTVLGQMSEFVKLYEMTMRAVNASPYYFFPQAYYENLRHRLSGRMKLLFALLNESPVAASLFFLCGDTIQYHLSGSDPAFGRRRSEATKLILDTMRRWGRDNGFRWLHLGGGVGGRHDSLFDFKAGFSDLRCPFYVVNYVVQPDVYADLVTRRFGQALDPLSLGNWFPAYRQPVIRRAA